MKHHSFHHVKFSAQVLQWTLVFWVVVSTLGIIWLHKIINNYFTSQHLVSRILPLVTPVQPKVAELDKIITEQKNKTSATFNFDGFNSKFIYLSTKIKLTDLEKANQK